MTAIECPYSGFSGTGSHYNREESKYKCLQKKTGKNPANIYFKEIKEEKNSGRAILHTLITRPVTRPAIRTATRRAIAACPISMRSQIYFGRQTRIVTPGGPELLGTISMVI